jgi:hypothetical protein
VKVLVVGSVRGEKAGEELACADEIRAAALEIGKELATRGHVVWVGTDDKIDVDPSVVEGALSASGGKGSVEVHAPLGMAEPYKNRSEPNLSKKWHQFPDWDVTNMEVVRGVDAVLAISGRAGVVQAGIAGWMLGVPVIPIAGFGGGAMKVWEYGSSRRQEFYHGALRDDEIDRLAAPWGKALDAKVAVETLEKVARAAKISRTPSRMLFSVLAMMIVSLAAWVCFLTFPFVLAPRLFERGWDSKDSLLVLFAAVSFSGLLGATMQTLRSIRNGVAVTPLVTIVDTGLGVTAGIVMAMLYLLAQVAVSGTVNPDLDPKDFVRVALIVSLASLFASLYLDAALARFDKIKGSVFTGKYSASETD